ncbi:MAG: hypothetical protein ACREAM_03825 [Blastocatellia bacterium]
MVGDRVFQLEQTSERFFELSGPERLAAADAQQLHGDAQSPIQVLHVAHDNRLHTEFAARLERVEGFFVISTNRGGGANLDDARAAESCDQGVGDSKAQRQIIAVRVQRGEREHGHGVHYQFGSYARRSEAQSEEHPGQRHSGYPRGAALQQGQNQRAKAGLRFNARIGFG